MKKGALLFTGPLCKGLFTEGLFSKGLFFKGLLLACGLILTNPGVAGAAWQPGNLVWKVKHQEEEGFSTRVAYSSGYRTPDLRWNWRLVYNEPSADDRLSFFRTEVRKRAIDNWWYGGWGRFATQPACNYLGARLFLERTGSRSWSGRLWGEREQRVIPGKSAHVSSRLDEYSYHETGVRIRLRRTGFSWLGELRGREKEYRRLTKNSWRKLQLETGGEHRAGAHFFSLRYRESTGVYPQDAWKNEWGNYWNLRWEWQINNQTRLVTRGSRLFREWGEGKQREEWEITGVLEYPRSPEMTAAWMLAYRQAVRRDYWEYDPDDEEEWEEPGFRAGLRWQRVFPGCRVQIELFRLWQAEKVRHGIFLLLRGGEKKYRWQVGIAPWGGFNSSAEKGYWVETRYYF